MKNELRARFEQYRRTQIAEMRPVTNSDLLSFKNDKHLHSLRDTEFKVSISDADIKNGSPKIGDMVARNPKNHNDQWLVAEQYFKDNFETLHQTNEVEMLDKAFSEMNEEQKYADDPYAERPFPNSDLEARARVFLRTYQVSGKDWLRDKEDIISKLIVEFTTSLPSEWSGS